LGIRHCAWREKWEKYSPVVVESISKSRPVVLETEMAACTKSIVGNGQCITIINNFIENRSRRK